MKRYLSLFALAVSVSIGAAGADYPFHNLGLSDDERVDNVISLLTLDEKISLLSTDLGVPRLGIGHCHQVEGLHGLSLSGPGSDRKEKFPSTIFPQAYGLGRPGTVTSSAGLPRRLLRRRAIMPSIRALTGKLSS